MQNITTKTLLSIHLAHTIAAGSETLSAPVELAFAGESGKSAPDWIQIFPKGPVIKTNDGRSFKITNPSRLATLLNTANKPIMIDYDHKSHFTPEGGGDQTAAGWIASFEVREGEMWAKVEWTQTAAAKITAREYRFLSPEFNVDEKSGEVSDILAAALVNRPALNLVALAAQKQPSQKTQSQEVIMLKEIAKALGLDEGADEKTILAAIEQRDEEHKTELATAQSKAKTPSTDDFMPRADYNAVLARANTAESKLAESETASFKAKVEETIGLAVKDGKITPGSKGHYVALCTDEDQLKKVTEAIGATPVIASGTGITGKPEDEKTVLTAEEQSIASSLGLSEKDYAEHRTGLSA